MITIAELMEEISGTLSDTASSDIVVGRPVELGSVNIVPLSAVKIGFGGAGGEGDQQFGHRHGKKDKDTGGKGRGTGAGGGAKVRPVGIVIFSDQGVRVERIPEKESPLDKIFARIPDIIDRVHHSK